MKILGIIAEYNPFHNGHSYHIEKSRELTGADGVIAVMSGNFVQRGEPAIFDKWTRAEIAVRNGVDVVFELPFMYAVNSADNFAKGGVRLLDSLGCVDYLSFGIESGELSELDRAASVIAVETEEFKDMLKEGLDEGNSYPRARFAALVKMSKNNPELLKTPNNILAIEYLRYLKILGSEIVPVSVKREGAGYNDTEIMNENEKFASATTIRRMLLENAEISMISKYLSSETLDVINNIDNIVKLELNNLYNLISYEIVNRNPGELARIYAVTEGIQNRFKEAVRVSHDIESLIENSISKRYTQTRIKRALIQILAGMKRTDFEFVDDEKAMYGHVLAFSEKGAGIIKEIKKSDRCNIPIITNINKEPLRSDAERLLLEYDLKASDLYNLAARRNLYDYSDKVIKPFMEGK